MPRKTKYTKTLLESIVKKNFSWASVLRDLDLKPTGGNYRNIQNWVRYHGLNTQHFTGQGWSKGKTAMSNATVAIIAKKNAQTHQDVLIENYPGQISGQRLRKHMLSVGFKYICERGHAPEWMGKSLTLHIDHINGISNDNRPENLRFLCPNCHQQTKTWGNRKK